MKDLLFVFLGGGLGSILRYMVCRWLNTSFFPWGTLAVNIIGCFLVSLFGTWIARQSLPTDFRLLMVVGLCGGFTTFSTFGNETMTMLRNGHLLLSFIYIFLSVAAGIAAAYIGAKLLEA